MATEKRELHQEEVQGVSLWRDAWRRLRRNRMAVFGGVVVILFVLTALFAPWIAPYSYEYINFDNPQINKPPSWEHPFGTDGLGRDLFSRVIYGSRVSIAVGFVTGLVALVIGVSYGAIAGFVGGKLDEWMMRFADVLYSLPYMFFVILLMVIFGRNFIMLFVGIASVSWMTIARITRGQIMSLKNNEFVEAAKSIGASRRRIIFRHLIPNAMGPIIVYLTLTIPSIMLEEAFLSFLGLGVQAPMTSWGLLASEGKDVITTYPWRIIFPGLALTLMLFSLNFLGEGLRDALDPSQKNKM